MKTPSLNETLQCPNANKSEGEPACQLHVMACMSAHNPSPYTCPGISPIPMNARVCEILRPWRFTRGKQFALSGVRGTGHDAIPQNNGLMTTLVMISNRSWITPRFNIFPLSIAAFQGFPEVTQVLCGYVGM